MMALSEVDEARPEGPSSTGTSIPRAHARDAGPAAHPTDERPPGRNWPRGSAFAGPAIRRAMPAVPSRGDDLDLTIAQPRSEAGTSVRRLRWRPNGPRLGSSSDAQQVRSRDLAVSGSEFHLSGQRLAVITLKDEEQPLALRRAVLYRRGVATLGCHP